MQLDLFATNFGEERICTYNDEKYRVRDNGSIYRLRNPKKPNRKLDEIWLFGRSTFDGYLHVSGVIVHRIVARAFHGDPPEKGMVIDHIDTNKKNNRPENLRWLTRLDNLVLNPITAGRITRICGSVEAFLEDPARFKDIFRNPDFGWMGRVSKEEAQRTLVKFLKQSSATYNISYKKKSPKVHASSSETTNNIEESLSCTPHCLQRNWKTPTLFPLCPPELTEEPLLDYFDNLIERKIFCENKFNISTVKEARLDPIKAIIYVLSQFKKRTIKDFSLAKITFENGFFIHEGSGTYFQFEGAEKALCLAVGEEWTGGGTFDDFC